MHYMDASKVDSDAYALSKKVCLIDQQVAVIKRAERWAHTWVTSSYHDMTASRSCIDAVVGRYWSTGRVWHQWQTLAALAGIGDDVNAPIIGAEALQVAVPWEGMSAQCHHSTATTPGQGLACLTADAAKH